MPIEDNFVASYVTRGAITIDHKDHAKRAAEIMSELNIGCLIITMNGTPAGIITDKDIVSKIAAQDRVASSVELHEIMSQPLITIKGNATVREALNLMVKNGINHLVVKDNEAIIGIFSYRNLVNTEKAVL